AIAGALAAGRDAVLSTAREYVAGHTPAESLEIGRRVSSALVEIVAGLAVRPGFLIAKGGITAHDLATHALGGRRIFVPGQLLPGVPLWVLGAESRWPGLPYAVFPGNVGGPAALREAWSVERGA
ncbi:MAG TPA: nucleotide-binding domain containing protein, partial [Thermomicrobiales bacterium]|nr:nucleotide-binding domain containing protein [Thermomicrobiales bacterium]